MKYADVIHYIYTLISEENLVPGSQLPPENELIEKLKVSRITVRRAYQELIDSGIVERIRGSGTYLRQRPADIAPTENKLFYIPMILPDAQNDSRIAEFIRGAEKYLRDYSCYVSVHFTDFNSEEEKKLIQDLVNHGSRCLIVYPCSSSQNKEFYFHLIEKGVSIVFIDRKPQDIPCHLVTADSYRGGYLAGKHLASLGCKNLAAIFFGLEGTATTITDRIRGFQFAASEANISCRIPEKPFMPNTFTQSLRDFLEKPDPVDGLFCLNDSSAIPVIDFLQESGYKIPQELAVVSFDNLPTAANYSIPLTDVVQSYFEIGFQAAALAYDCIKERMEYFQTRIIPVSLIVRESSKKESSC